MFWTTPWTSREITSGAGTYRGGCSSSNDGVTAAADVVVFIKEDSSA